MILYYAEMLCSLGGGARDFYDVGVCEMWTTPKVTEIAVGLEINCYACADL